MQSVKNKFDSTGGDTWKFSYGKANPLPLLFYIPLLTEKVTPPSPLMNTFWLTNGNPFTYLQ